MHLSGLHRTPPFHSPVSVKGWSGAHRSGVIRFKAGLRQHIEDPCGVVTERTREYPTHLLHQWHQWCGAFERVLSQPAEAWSSDRINCGCKVRLNRADLV